MERQPHHLDSKLFGCFQQVPTALHREAEGHAGLSGMSLGGQLQQQPRRDEQTFILSEMYKYFFNLQSAPHFQ